MYIYIYIYLFIYLCEIRCYLEICILKIAVKLTASYYVSPV